MSGRGAGRGRGGGRGRQPQSSSGGRGFPGGGPPPPVRQPNPVASHYPNPSSTPSSDSQYPTLPSSSSTSPSLYPSLPTPSSLAGDIGLKLTLSSTPASSVQPPSTSQTPPLPIVTAPSSSKSLRPPVRPGFGRAGRKCVIRANHFLVDVIDKDLHHYDLVKNWDPLRSFVRLDSPVQVTISPEVTSKNVCREIISELVTLYRESHLGKSWPAYDGRKSLYTAGSLPFLSKDFVVKLVDKDRKERRERQFDVAIKFAGKADLHHLQQFIGGKQLDAPQETLQVLDVALRSAPSTNYVVVGRSFFSPDLGSPGTLGDGIQYWKGFYQSLRPTQMGVSLNVDTSARAFYEPVLVSEFVKGYCNIRDLRRPLSDQDRIRVKKALKTLRVKLVYAGRKYKISGVSAQPLSQLMFSRDDLGTMTSVVEYYRERYQIILSFPSLPGLQAGSDAKPVYLPMELCQIEPGQRYVKKLNDKQVTAMLRATCQRPPDREQSISKMVAINSYNDDILVKEFGLRVKPELASVDARVLPPPMLQYLGKQEVPQVGCWNMIDKKMVNGGKVEFWTCVSFSRLRENEVYRFCEELVNMCRNKGMDFNPRPIIPIDSAHPGRIEDALIDIHKQSNEVLLKMGYTGKQLQLLVIILPEASGSYGTIKRVCETELGIISQCSQPRHATKCSKQYLENLSLKINVKAGGRNTKLFDANPREKKLYLLNDLVTIIFGADVTHPQPGEDSSSSIAAVVASMDWPEVTKYRGLVSAQGHREEIICDLYTATEDPKKGLVHGGMIREQLIAFRRATGRKPDRILFYRDGVSEGQFAQVLLREVDAIRKACVSLEANYLPRITFVVVQKRHHTRLFPARHGERGSTDKSGNILPGTVVDSKICHPTEFDFYLCSHAGIQGTSRPTHYHVLYDENQFSADDLQMLTNNLCYTYARCTRSVSIVPPAYYAHLAAFRARYYIEGQMLEGGSSSGERGTAERITEVRPLPKIKDNVKDVMFYC